MELLLLKAVAFSRPLLSMRFGEDYFALFGIALFVVLVSTLLIRAATAKALRISPIDFLIVAFALWCLARALIYVDGSYIEELAKLLIPLIGYVVAKNVIPDRREYRRVLLWIIVGFSIPVLVSAAQILAGRPEAVYMEMYFTGLLRWQGAYYGAHNFGHSMALFLMALIVYMTLKQSANGEQGTRVRVENAVLISLAAVAVFCLYKSQVRSAVLGLLVFLALYGALQNRRAFVVGAGALAVVAVIAAASWVPALLHEFAPDRRGGEPELMELGSGRPARWANDIALFARLSLDKQLAGIGIGVDRVEDVGTVGGHSDWLRIVWDTGLVGFTLYALLQLLIFRAILRLSGRERNLFLAIFFAVNAMMLVSNSYALRIQVSQLYYIILAYVEIPPARRQPLPASIWLAGSSANSRVREVGQH